MLFLQARGETEQILETATRHHDVLVEFDEAGVTQRIRKFAADSPEFLARCRAQSLNDKLGFELGDDRSDLLKFRRHSGLLAIQFDNEMSIAADEHFAARAFVRRRHGKRIGELNRTRQ